MKTFNWQIGWNTSPSLTRDTCCWMLKRCSYQLSFPLTCATHRGFYKHKHYFTVNYRDVVLNIVVKLNRVSDVFNKQAPEQNDDRGGNVFLRITKKMENNDIQKLCTDRVVTEVLIVACASPLFFAFPVTVLVVFLSHCAENYILPLNEQFNYFQYLIIILHRFPLVTVPR